MTDDQKRSELLRLKKANGGRLSAEMLVKVARDPVNPFHKFFLWDDAKAAYKFRLDIARDLIASVRINLIADKKHVRTICFVRDPHLEPTVQGYAEVNSLRRSRTDSLLIMDSELARAEAALHRAKEIGEAVLPDLVDQIGALITQIDAMRQGLTINKKAA